MLNFYFEITNLTKHEMKLLGQPPFDDLPKIIEDNQYQEFTASLLPDQSIDLECHIQGKGSYKFQFRYRVQQQSHRFICEYQYPPGYEAIIITNVIHPQFQIDISCRPKIFLNLPPNGHSTKPRDNPPANSSAG